MEVVVARKVVQGVGKKVAEKVVSKIQIPKISLAVGIINGLDVDLVDPCLYIQNGSLQSTVPIMIPAGQHIVINFRESTIFGSKGLITYQIKGNEDAYVAIAFRIPFWKNTLSNYYNIRIVATRESDLGSLFDNLCGKWDPIKIHTDSAWRRWDYSEGPNRCHIDACLTNGMKASLEVHLCRNKDYGIEIPADRCLSLTG